MTERDPGADTARFHMSTDVHLGNTHAACPPCNVRQRTEGPFGGLYSGSQCGIN